MNTQANTEKMHSNARIDPSLSNEEMEAAIKEFIKKLEEPSSYSAMNYEEAFEYIEATLNYKYVNYDYSKCANTEEFNGSVQFTSNGDGEMDMEAIANVYDAILQDWKAKYHSISEDVKTPIVFDIIDVTANNVKYTMVVGYGALDLSLWGEEFVPLSSTYYKTAGDQFTYQLYAQLHNNQIQLTPPLGARLYSSTSYTCWVDAYNYPSNPSTSSINPEPLPPLGNGYTDYKLFYSSYSETGYHLDLNQIEYGYHKDMIQVIMFDFLQSRPDANFISDAYVSSYGLNPYYYKVFHYLHITLGIRYWTYTPISSL